MNSYRLENYHKGWFLGNFQPTIFANGDFEVAVKVFQKGDQEPSHKQLISTEVTVVIEGDIQLGSSFFSAGDIIEIPPGEFASFTSLTNSILVCIKYPSIPDDKVIG
jgi:hypothetical protein